MAHPSARPRANTLFPGLRRESNPLLGLNDFGRSHDWKADMLCMFSAKPLGKMMAGDIEKSQDTCIHIIYIGFSGQLWTIGAPCSKLIACIDWLRMDA